MAGRGQRSKEVGSVQYAAGSRRLRFIAHCLLLTTYCLLFILPGCGREPEEGSIRKTLPKEGDSAAPLSLQLFDGKEFRLEDVKEMPVVINFWASWCKPCREEAPALQKVYTEYKDKGVVFLGIAIQDTETKARAYVQEFGITFPVGLDSTGDIAEGYRIYGIPKTFIIGKDRKFAYVHMGEITEEDLRREIEKVL